MRAIFPESGDEPGPHEPRRAGASPACIVCGRDHERQRRRGVFDVDEDRALEALRLSWGRCLRHRHENGRWVASRRDGRGGPLEGATPDELNRQMRADWGTP